MIDNKYEDVNPPLSKVEKFEDSMEYDLTGAELLAYLGTWSALQVAKKSDPSRDWLLDMREAYV